jgi:hypothetical protein
VLRFLVTFGSGTFHVKSTVEMSKNQETGDPKCVIKMLNEFRSCNPSVNLPNFIDNSSIAVVAKRLHFNDSAVSGESKRRKCTDTNVSIGMTKISADDSDLSVMISYECISDM